MTMPIATRERIREMSAEGYSQREISDKLEVSRNTTAKYAAKEDFSPEPPCVLSSTVFGKGLRWHTWTKLRDY